MRVIAITLSGLLLVLPLSGCGKGGEDEKEKQEEADDAPPPPPIGTLSIDTDFSDGSSFRNLTENLGLNHGAAYLIAVAVNVHIGASLSIPLVLLQKATEVTPTLSAPNTFLWSYDFTIGARKWTANFTGTRLEADSYTWSMRVTSDPKDANGCCNDFEFFSGASNGQGAGSWQLYDPAKPTAAAKLFNISYDYTSDAEKTLTYLINSDKPPSEKFGNGSSVVYKVATDDVTMTIKDSAENASRIITWNRTTKAGSHTDPQGKKSCWDTKTNNFADMTCP